MNIWAPRKHRNLHQVLLFLKQDLARNRSDIHAQADARILCKILPAELLEAYETNCSSLSDPQARFAHETSKASFDDIASVLLTCLYSRDAQRLYALFHLPKRSSGQTLRQALTTWRDTLAAWSALHFPTPSSTCFFTVAGLLTNHERIVFSARLPKPPHKEKRVVPFQLQVNEIAPVLVDFPTAGAY